jgi:hypothetical protein
MAIRKMAEILPQDSELREFLCEADFIQEWWKWKWLWIWIWIGFEMIRIWSIWKNCESKDFVKINWKQCKICFWVLLGNGESDFTFRLGISNCRMTALVHHEWLFTCLHLWSE